MIDQPESELAWLLAEQNYECLTLTERHTVFIHLGIEDYPPAIACVLAAVARHGRTVPESTVHQLRSWVVRYHQRHHADLVNRVAAISSGESQ